MAKSFRLRKKLAKKQGKPIPKKGIPKQQPVNSYKADDLIAKMERESEQRRKKLEEELAILGVGADPREEAIFKEAMKSIDDLVDKQLKMASAGASKEAIDKFREAGTKDLAKKDIAKLNTLRAVIAQEKIKEAMDKEEEEIDKAMEQRKKEAVREDINELNENELKAALARKEFLIDMLTTQTGGRLEGVPQALIDEVKEALYNANDDDIKFLTFYFAEKEEAYKDRGTEFWKDFYVSTNPREGRKSTVQQQIDILESVLDYFERKGK